jgi:hypothetical protein
MPIATCEGSTESSGRHPPPPAWPTERLLMNGLLNSNDYSNTDSRVVFSGIASIQGTTMSARRIGAQHAKPR